jgi:hypothetical protein
VVVFGTIDKHCNYWYTTLPWSNFPKTGSAFNPHDQEAIKVEMIPIGKIGYVANSPHTVPKGCRSAGRIYDMFDYHICAVIRFVMKDIVIVELIPGVEEVYIIRSTADVSFVHSL